jgi:hypothetical protein
MIEQRGASIINSDSWDVRWVRHLPLKARSSPGRSLSANQFGRALLVMGGARLISGPLWEPATGSNVSVALDTSNEPEYQLICLVRCLFNRESGENPERPRHCERGEREQRMPLG